MHMCEWLFTQLNDNKHEWNGIVMHEELFISAAEFHTKWFRTEFQTVLYTHSKFLHEKLSSYQNKWRSNGDIFLLSGIYNFKNNDTLKFMNQSSMFHQKIRSFSLSQTQCAIAPLLTTGTELSQSRSSAKKCTWSGVGETLAEDRLRTPVIRVKNSRVGGFRRCRPCATRR